MKFATLKQLQRRELLAQPFPPQWLDPLQQVALYRTLAETEQAKLRDAVRIVIAEKYWEGCNGFAITDAVRVAIAAQASLLLLGFDDYYFDELQTILVYPGGYLQPDRWTERGIHTFGEAHHRGPVVLGWWHVQWSGRRLGHSNLVLHEFAHKLGEFGDPEEGMPPIDDPVLQRRWRKVVRAEYEQLIDDTSYDRPTLLDAYGTSHPTEFFAVATECFFLQPVALRRRHRRLYELLAAWYRQDPAERPVGEKETPEQTAEAECAYQRQLVLECSEAIRRQPDDEDAYRQRACSYANLGEYEPAIADCTTALRLCDDDARPEIYCERGALYREQGDHARSLADLSHALRLCPDDGHAWCQRARTRAEQGDAAGALADLDRAIRLDPQDDGAYTQRGLVYLQQGRYPEAIRDFTRALRRYRYDPEAYRGRAAAYAACGEAEKAQADRARAAELAD